MIHQNLPNSILQWITVSKTIYHHALKSAKQDFLMDLYLFHQQRQAEDGKTWLVEHVEREELHSTTDRPLEVPLKSDGRRFELDDLL
jgi:hypothetical protein